MKQIRIGFAKEMLRHYHVNVNVVKKVFYTGTDIIASAILGQFPMT